MVSHYRNWHSLFAFSEQGFQRHRHTHYEQNPMKFYDQRRTMNGNPFNYINIIEMFGLC